VQSAGVGPSLVRLIGTAPPDLLTTLLAPGRVLEAEVISLFQGRGILSFGRGVRLEVALQAALQEGQRVQVQVQPQEANQPAIFLKLLSTAPATAQGAAPPTAQAPPQAGQVVWLPIPLPGDGQGWAQLHIHEEPDRRGAPGAAPQRQVRLYWETPALGPIQMVMDAPERSLVALFTAVAPGSRASLEQAMPMLRERLAAAGFPDVKLGLRSPAPGEEVLPLRPAGAARVDRRI
jgi:hypothetical protein